MSSPPATAPRRLSLLRLARRQLAFERESAAGVALALLLALVPAGLLLVEGLGARGDLRAVLVASEGVVVQHAGISDARSFDAFQQRAREQVGTRLGRYLDAGSERALAGPYRVELLDSRPPEPPLDSVDVDVTYVSDLAARVDVRQGVLAHAEVAGVEKTVTMPMPVADRAGIRLFDVVCLRVPTRDAPGSSDWCARVVGLWRPNAGGDPRWTGPGSRLQLFTDREQFFGLVGLQPTQPTLASRQYGARPDRIAPQDAGGLAAGVRQLRSSVVAAGVGEVPSGLDADLDRYGAARGVSSFPVKLLAAALVPLLVLLAGVLGRWYVEPRLHDLALLRARGWSGVRVRRLVLAQFGMLEAAALAVAAVLVAILAWRAQAASIGPRSVSPSQSELVGVAATALIPLVAAGWYVGLAWWASRQSVLCLEHQDAMPDPELPRRGADRNALFALPAALLLLLPRLVTSQRWFVPGTINDLGAAVVSVAGLVMLVVAALPALSLLAEARTRRRADLEGTLAHWHLRRWWQRHAASGFLIVFAFAVASFAAVALANQLLNPATRAAGSLEQGVAASLAIGFASSIAAALMAFGLVFLFAGRSRVDDYAALLVDGLPAASVRRSLALEQHTVLAEALLVGLALGLVLAWTTAPALGVQGQPGAALTPAAAAAGVLAALAIAVLAGAPIAWLARRGAVGFSLVVQGRRNT